MSLPPASRRLIDRPLTKRCHQVLSALSATILLLPPAAFTAPIEWNNTGTDWATGANWLLGVAPADSTSIDSAVFGSSGTGPIHPLLSATRSISGVSFLSGAFGYSIASTGGAILRVSSGGIANQSTATQTFDLTLATTISQSWSLGAGSTTVFNGIVDLNNNATSSRILTLTGAGNATFSTLQNSFSGSTGGLTQSSTGITRLTASNSYNGNTTVTAGLLRLDHAGALPGGVAATGGTSALVFNGSGVNGGVLGLTAATGDFTRSLGTATPTSALVGWASNATGGFAAFGGDRLVNFGGANASITWSATSGSLGAGLILGHSTADSTVTVTNPIGLNAGNRTVMVNDGSAAVDGVLSGVLSGTMSTLIKSGPGTLALTAANTFGSSLAAGSTFLTVSGGTLQLGNGGTTGALTTTTTGEIQNDGILAVNRTNTLTLPYVIKGSGGVSQLGTGTAILSGINTYTGPTTVSAGTLSVSSSANLGNASSQLIFDGGALQITGTALTSLSTLGRSVILNAGKNVGIDINSASHSFSLDQELNQTTGGFTKLGAGTAVIGQASTYSGNTTLTGGVLRLDHANALPGGVAATGGTSALVFNGGILGLTAATGDFTRSLGSNTPSASQVGWASSASGGFAAFGGNRLVNFGGANALVTWNSLTGSLGTALILGHSTADSTVTVTNPIALNLGNRTVTANDGSAAVDGVLSGVISGTGSTLIKNGLGTLALTGTNSFGSALAAGTTFVTISSGTLQIGNGGTTGSLTTTPTGEIQNDGILAVNRTNTLTLPYVIKGSGSVVQSGTGTTVLSGNNIYTGSTTISNGTLSVSSSAHLGDSTAELIFDGGALQITGTALTSLSTLGHSVILNAGKNVGIDINSASHSFNLDQELNQTTGGFTKLGAGTAVIAQASSYSGNTTVSGGVLRLNDANALPGGVGSTGGTSALIFNGGVIGLTAATGDFTRSLVGLTPGATQVGWAANATGGFAAFGGNRLVNFGGANALITWSGVGGVLGSALVLSHATSDSTITVTNPIAFNSAERTLTVNNGSADVDAVMSGQMSGTLSSLVKNGAGTLALTAANSFGANLTTGTTFTTISAGTLQLGNGGTTGSLSSVSTADIQNDGVLAFNRSNALNMPYLIQGSGSVNQIGAGTTTLSASNTYSGGTQLLAGTLLVTNSSGSGTGSGPVQTSAGTTLGGTGTLSPTGAQGISISGTVSPGVAGVNGGIGTLSFKPVDGHLTFATGSQLRLELTSTSSFDRLTFEAAGSGMLDFSAASSQSIRVLFSGYTPSLHDSFDLLDWTALTGSGVSGLNAGLLDLPTTGFQPDWFWDTTQFSSSGLIFISVVPEPSRCLLALLGCLSLSLRRRRHGD